MAQYRIRFDYRTPRRIVQRHTVWETESRSDFLLMKHLLENAIDVGLQVTDIQAEVETPARWEDYDGSAWPEDY